VHHDASENPELGIWQSRHMEPTRANHERQLTRQPAASLLCTCTYAQDPNNSQGPSRPGTGGGDICASDPDLVVAVPAVEVRIQNSDNSEPTDDTEEALHVLKPATSLLSTSEDAFDYSDGSIPPTPPGSVRQKPSRSSKGMLRRLKSIKSRVGRWGSSLFRRSRSSARPQVVEEDDTLMEIVIQ